MQSPPKCRCVCHGSHFSRACCEHCKGDNDVTRYHLRRQRWHWRWTQNVHTFVRDLLFIARNRRIPATWTMPKYKSPFKDGEQ